MSGAEPLEPGDPARPAEQAVAAGPAARAARGSVLAAVWHSRVYRSTSIALFISGIAISSANPQLALYFVNELHTSITVAGLFYLTNVAAPIVGFVIGRMSDRVSNRLLIFRLGATMVAIGWLAIGAASDVAVPFVVSVLCLSFSGASSAQLYATVREELTAQQRAGTDAGDERVISTVRMAFTAGWIVGPVLGSWFGGVLGLRAVFFATAALTLLQLVPMIGVRVGRAAVIAGDGATEASVTSSASPVSSASSGRAARAVDRRLALPLFAFAGLCMVALSGDTLKFAFLPIYLDNGLGASPAVRGAVIATQPVLELMLIPVATLFAARFGALRVVVVCSLAGIAAHLCYALSTQVWQVFLGQVLMSVLWAAMAGLGVTVAQRLYPSGPGFATSVFLSTTTFASTLGGVIGSLGAQPLGLPHLYFIPAGLCALATVGLLGLQLRMGRAAAP